MSTTTYVDEDVVQQALGVRTGEYDEPIRSAIETASREIDAHCGRSFYLAEDATPRVYYPDDWLTVRIDDAVAIATVKMDTSADGSFATTMATTGYVTEPLNGVVAGLTGWPVTRLRAVATNQFWPTYNGRPSVQVTPTSWGWAACPAPVRQACTILSEALVKQLEAPGGIAGTGEFGAIRVANNELNLVRAKLAPYIKAGGLGIGAFA